MLGRRGPDGTRHFCNGPVGLGHTLLGTTPELLFENQPFHHSETGCVITADVRLDNRSELLNAIGQIRRQDSIGDAELILLSYLKWNDACVDHLLGDFAFAISDPRSQRLFCARDHSGMRPFYYHSVTGQRFVFASDARAILVLPEVPYQVNQARIADYLIPELEWVDYTSTFYEGVYRLPPGHRATVTARGVDIVEYWKPEPRPASEALSDDDYEEGFLEVFTRAIASRLRAPPDQVGSMLSGGMDSGSVVAVARGILNARGDTPLCTYSCVSDTDTDCLESRLIRAHITVPSIRPTLISPPDRQDTQESPVSGLEEPFDGEFLILKSIYASASEHGQRVVLDGGGGDIVLGAGSHIVRLIKQCRFRQAAADVAAEKNYWDGASFLRDLLYYARAAVVPEAIKTRLRPIRYRRKVGGFVTASLISGDFARSIDTDDRFERLRQMFPEQWAPDYAAERCNAIRPNVTGGRERYARLAASTAVEASDPFLDKRVIEYCAGLPGRVRLNNGWPKMLLRKLMAGKIPDEVRWSRGKPHLGWLFNDAATRQALDSGEVSLSSLREDLRDYVDTASLTAAWQGFAGGGEAAQIHSANVLSVWLRETAHRPVAPD
jgi:asparagine synthase (glutamine-hydrolysing)